MRRREATQQTQSNSNTADISSDSDDVCHNRAKNVSLYVSMLIIETEIMDLYKEQFGYDPREPQTYKYFTEEEQIERYAQNVVFWRKLLNEYNVKEPHDIHKVKTNMRWQYIMKKEGEVCMWFYKKFKDLPHVNEKIGQRVHELMNN